jgi:hypothetical protein
MRITEILTIMVLVLCLMLCQVRVVEAVVVSTILDPLFIGTGPLPEPIVTQNSVEICLNSRYSRHALGGTAADQQISNIVWAAGKAPFTGTHRDIYIATPTGTYLYDPNNHSLSFDSNDIRDDGAFAIIYESQLDFDTGVSFMPALLASVSLCNSTESPVASCPKGIGYPKSRLIFGVQEVGGLTYELVVHSSVSEGEPGWLPDPSTTGENSIEVVLANLNYVEHFVQTDLTLQQISQTLWAGYGCTPHITNNGRNGLTVPSARANYYLTRAIYLANEDGVYRYHNRNPSTDLTTMDHRLEQVKLDDVRDSLRSAVSSLPKAPCYVILCLDSSIGLSELTGLETGFVAGNMLIQASAIGLGCHFKTELTSGEQGSIQTATGIPLSHLPQVVVSIGPLCVDFEEYARFAENWLQTNCNGLNNWCDGADFEPDGDVDRLDLKRFLDKWLAFCP